MLVVVALPNPKHQRHARNGEEADLEVLQYLILAVVEIRCGPGLSKETYHTYTFVDTSEVAALGEQTGHTYKTAGAWGAVAGKSRGW